MDRSSPSFEGEEHLFANVINDGILPMRSRTCHLYPVTVKEFGVVDFSITFHIT